MIAPSHCTPEGKEKQAADGYSYLQIEFPSSAYLKYIHGHNTRVDGLKPSPAPNDVLAYLKQQKERSHNPKVDPIIGNILVNPAIGVGKVDVLDS